jgi:TonB-linked SusC/RagA family outer membrane protein
MNKILLSIHLNHNKSLPQLARIMKIVFILTFICSVHVSAKVYSQERFTLNMSNVSVDKVLNKIQSESNYRFFYNFGYLKHLDKLNVVAKNETLPEILNKLLDSTLSYQVLDDNLVVISLKGTQQLQHRIEGKVTDEKGSPLPGVSVQIKGTSQGAITNGAGRFTLLVPDNAVLTVSFVGYETQEITVGNQTTFNIELKVAASGLNEVVVVGYGTTKKATLTGAISSVKGSEVVKSPATNVSNDLVGRLPGLVAIQPSGEPGYDGSTLRIRGLNTLNNNNVLVVVDGIAGRSLDRIDPYSIESITILKDASAAIYGAQAANGVILITTKRGRLGKPEITFNVNAGYNQPTKIPKMADAATYATMLNEIAEYGNAQLPFSKDDIQKFADGTDPWGHPNTDWFASVLKKRSAQNSYNMTVSGGTESLRYFVSLGTKTQEGNYYHSGTKYNQYDFRSNLDGKITKDISLAFDVTGRMEDRNFPTRSAGDIFRMIMRGKPNLPAYWPDGTPGPDIEYGNNPAVISTDATGYDRDKNYVLNTNLRLNIDIPWVKGLSVTGNAAIDKGFDFRKLWQTPWYLYTWDGTSRDANGKPVLVKGKRGFDAPQLTEYAADNISTTINALLNYDRTFGDHGIKFLAGIEEIKGNGDNFSASKQHYVSTAIDQLFAGASLDKDNNGSGFINSRLSYFGRVNYSFRDKYLAEFVWRYDGSYIFPPNGKQFGFFPGVSAGWVVSKEGFFKSATNVIDFLKIRGSWGQTGNDRIPEWQYLATYAYGNFLGQPYYPFVTGGGVENQTLYETRVPNPNITWEVANQGDIGFDATLFNNKVSITADYFNYKRSHILLPPNASIPLSAGFTPPYENIGKVGNKGFDFNVSYSDDIGKLNFTIGVNGGYAKNRIIFWDETPGAPGYQKSTGHPMNTSLYYVAEGVFPDSASVAKVPHWDGARAGDIIFKDVNGDGKIDANDRVRIDKNSVPTFTGGVSLELRYGQFDLSILLQAATGAVNYISTESGEIGDFLESFAAGRWTDANHSTTQPRTFNRSNEYWVNQNNTFWLHKTDYLRLKNLQLGYSLPHNITKKLGIQAFRVYASGYNLLTYSPDYKDFDPEASAGSGQSYPLQRVVTAGLSVTF